MLSDRLQVLLVALHQAFLAFSPFQQLEDLFYLHFQAL